MPLKISHFIDNIAVVEEGLGNIEVKANQKERNEEAFAWFLPDFIDILKSMKLKTYYKLQGGNASVCMNCGGKDIAIYSVYYHDAPKPHLEICSRYPKALEILQSIKDHS